MEPALGRFTTMDPMAEKYYSWSPYHYAANNPMRITDPNGKDWRDFLIGVGTGIVNSLQATGYAITHPIETIKNLSQASFEDRKAMAVDNATLGNLSFIQTAVTDIQSGNGSATGKAIGSIAAQVGMAAATARVGSAIGKGINTTTLYRGINSGAGTAYKDAVNGVVKPRGGTSGHTNPSLHNFGGTANSRFTSWSSDFEVAKNYALRNSGQGIVLKKTVPQSSLIASPNRKTVSLIQSPGTVVNESEVLLRGTINHATVFPVKLP